MYHFGSQRPIAGSCIKAETISRGTQEQRDKSPAEDVWCAKVDQELVKEWEHNAAHGIPNVQVFRAFIQDLLYCSFDIIISNHSGNQELKPNLEEDDA
mmetsp:Transcript_1531/g.2894  ORF Transcript_1531/g.2894 Transcript_1531/m.2894 type:complete len:98 (+) Transcript_1531:908-1201(+)